MAEGAPEAKKAAESADERHSRLDKAPADLAENSISGIKGRRLWAFRITAVIFPPLLFLLLLEGGLRVIGYGRPVSYTLKHRIHQHEYFLANPGFGCRFFPPRIGSKLFTLLAYPVVKPEQTYRIFILGGSAAAGDPESAYGFSRILEVMLRDKYPETDFEVINTALAAINSHVVRHIAAEIAGHNPDLFIVYMGNNEVVGPFGAGGNLPSQPFLSLLLIRTRLFIGTTRVGQLLNNIVFFRESTRDRMEGGLMQQFLKQQVRPDDPKLKRIYSHFQANLTDICRIARSADVPIVVSTIGVNLRSCAPFASQHRPDLGPGEEKTWSKLYQQGIEFEAGGEPARATQACLKAAGIDDRFADLHYRLARCYWHLGEYGKAREHYRLALEQDTLRFRADREINEIIYSLAEGKSAGGIHLVEAERAFERNSPWGTPGEELFYEHVHMNFRGNYVLAKAFFEQIESILPDWVLGDKAERSLLTEEECVRRLAFTPYDAYLVARNVLRRMQNPPFTNQLDARERNGQLRLQISNFEAGFSDSVVDESRSLYRYAIDHHPGDLTLRRRYVSFLQTMDKDPVAAEAELRAAVKQVPYPAAVLNSLGVLLVKQERIGEAIELFQEAAENAPYYADVHSNLGAALLRQGQYEKALEHYRKAIRLDPVSVEAFSGTGEILLSQGKAARAVPCFKRAIALRGETPALLTNLGLALLGAEKFGEAIEPLEKTVRAEPVNPEANANLGYALYRAGKPARAREYFQKALELDPNNIAVVNNLAWLLATSPRDDVRDGTLAVELAARACAAAEYKQPTLLDTLSAAYAEAGKFPEAAATAEEALKLVPKREKGLRVQISRRLKLYQQGRAYREQ